MEKIPPCKQPIMVKLAFYPGLSLPYPPFSSAPAVTKETSFFVFFHELLSLNTRKSRDYQIQGFSNFAMCKTHVGSSKENGM